jgi:hypothetical protein
VRLNPAFVGNLKEICAPFSNHGPMFSVIFVSYHIKRNKAPRSTATKVNAISFSSKQPNNDNYTQVIYDILIGLLVVALKELREAMDFGCFDIRLREVVSCDISHQWRTAQVQHVLQMSLTTVTH